MEIWRRWFAYGLTGTVLRTICCFGGIGTPPMRLRRYRF
jgi:hypothetical protein